jgi:lipopolysaccharide transport system ATP-binding protein
LKLYVALECVSKVYPHGNSATGDLMNAMSAPAAHAELTKGKVAVSQVSLTLNEGERLGIIGRNGAGKSTLLHMIAGISEPTTGSIRVNGKVTSIMTLGIGLRDDLTGRENIYIDGEIQGKSRKEVDEVIGQVIEFSELGEFIDYPVRTYSTGMKSRLAFSMITHIEPEILIIDEALSVGDAAFAKKATARILEICAKGKIVILVSHGMQSVREICNRCIYLKDGQVVMDGSPEAVTEAYIDEVKGEDEVALKNRFASHAGNHSLVSGYKLETTDLIAGDLQRHSIRIEAEQTLIVRIRGTRPLANRAAIFQVRIVRLDDLLLFEHAFLISSYSYEADIFGAEIEFAPLPLAPAVYRIDVELRDSQASDATACATTSSIFEVYSLSPLSGGKPMLYYPVRNNAGGI